ncbi:MAG: regulatory protein [Candidatus Sumerlaeota bacterium]|nr:regulatory protein [Candidatus Sumerlaeota bacterium]
MPLRLLTVKLKSKRTGRVLLTFDNGAGPDDPVELELAGEVYATSGLGTGDSVTEQRLETLKADDQRHLCRQRAWSLLAHRPRSREELRRALRQRKFPAHLVDALITDLAAKGYLDDEAYARLAVDQAKTSGRNGPRLLRQKLAQKGIRGDLADAALTPVEDPEHQRTAARALLIKWNRRSKPAEPDKRRQAAAAFLLRRGFDADIVWDLVREVLGENEE